MKRHIAHWLTALLLGTGFASALAQGTGTPLRIIVPFAAGGSTDVIARSIGQKVGEILGQPVVVENRPGGGTLIGARGCPATVFVCEARSGGDQSCTS